MPMSEEAATGLAAAVAYNPSAAQHFMHALRFLPQGVRHKPEDRFGPLSLLINGTRSLVFTEEVTFPVQDQQAFPQDKLDLCEIFNREWLEGRFSKEELADAIARILAEIKPRPLLKTDEPSTLIITTQGTYLSSNTQNPEHKRKIDLSDSGQ
ncbi:MAG: hypothetical protein JOZ18_04280 [Chloroflexi bacterium]|nr:hypothetical protein [Chloroflexota bacterium]